MLNSACISPSVGISNSTYPKPRVLSRIRVLQPQNLGLTLRLLHGLGTGSSTLDSPLRDRRYGDGGGLGSRACFRTLSPAAEWGMGWRGENRGSLRGSWIEVFPITGKQASQHTLHRDPRANLMLLPSNSPASPRDLKLGPLQGWGNDQRNYKGSGGSYISSFLKSWAPHKNQAQL